MAEDALLALVTIAVLGAAAQWLAWRIRLPSILVLLCCGFLAGPVARLIDPDRLLGELLLPLVSLAVALILYEGGLSLRFAELAGVGHVVRNLVVTGALITWGIAGLGAYVLFDLGAALSVLLGAVLIVTGPTVIIPLLQHIRPAGPVGPILKWEGIVIDPIGALVAVLVFEVILMADPALASTHVALGVLKTLVAGGGLGLVAAALLTLVLVRYWVPDSLRNAISLMFVLGTFTAANRVQPEAGLFAATVMGVALANQKLADVRPIVEFKENLRVLLISALFIILAARLELAQLAQVAIPGSVFIIGLVGIARPLAVWVSTWRSKLSRPERTFLACVAPRGIVAASVASVFALRLQEAGYAEAASLVPITFIVIVGTVAVYGLGSPVVARRLGVAVSNPQGVLLVGAGPWVRALAEFLHGKGYRVRLVDTNRSQTAAARMAGLPTFSGSALADRALDTIDLGGIGRLLAVTPNDWVNALAVQRFTRILGRANCYQLPPAGEPGKSGPEHRHLQGRWLFVPDADSATLEDRFAAGYAIKATPLSAEFGFTEFQRLYGEGTVPMMLINENGAIEVITAEKPPAPKPGQTLVALVRTGNA